MGRESVGNLAVLSKTYDLVLWNCQRIAKFPRSHRCTLGDRLECTLYNTHELLLRAKYNRDRIPLLRDVNMNLELLRFNFRLAKDLRCLPLDSYEHAQRLVNEVGQMVGSWLKYCTGPAQAGKEGAHAPPRQPVAKADQLSQPAPGGPASPPGQTPPGQRPPF